MSTLYFQIPDTHFLLFLNENTFEKNKMVIIYIMLPRIMQPCLFFLHFIQWLVPEPLPIVTLTYRPLTINKYTSV